MNTPLAIIIGVVVGLGAGIGLAYNILKKTITRNSSEVLKNAQDEAKAIKKKAEEDGELLKKEKILQAKEKFLQLKGEHEKTVNEKNQQIAAGENRIKQKEANLNQKLEELNRKTADNAALKEKLERQIEANNLKQAELDKQTSVQKAKLESIAELSAEQAKEQLIQLMEDEARAEAMVTIKEIVDEAQNTAALEAKKLVIKSIQRTGVETALENAVSVFTIENDDIKGRIIGREGRNIRALEKLVSDGRIHPARIEEVVAKTKKQIEQEINETGKRTCIDLGIHNISHELMRMVGKMRYRSSYGQNLLQHSKEVANLCATMAAELGLNPKLAKRAGLLHDIGKVPDTEPELPHALFGAQLAEQYKEKPEIVNAIGAHHDEMEMTNLISPLVQVCDAISGARPGARREVVEAYMKRLNDLETLALSYPGVVKTFAIQAGRELRVIVGAEKVSDEQADKISFDLSKKIQNEMTYPGQIKITVIRETRSVNYAR